MQRRTGEGISRDPEANRSNGTAKLN